LDIGNESIDLVGRTYKSVSELRNATCPVKIHRAGRPHIAEQLSHKRKSEMAAGTSQDL
jgi:hypothetical protein